MNLLTEYRGRLFYPAGKSGEPFCYSKTSFCYEPRSRKGLNPDNLPIRMRPPVRRFDLEATLLAHTHTTLTAELQRRAPVALELVPEGIPAVEVRVIRVRSLLAPSDTAPAQMVGRAIRVQSLALEGVPELEVSMTGKLEKHRTDDALRVLLGLDYIDDLT